MPLLYSNTVIVINPNNADRMANSVDPDLTDCTFRSNLIFVYTVCWDLHVSVWTLRIVRTSATFSSHLFSWSCSLASYALWNAVTADIDKSETFSGKWSPSSPTPLWNNLSQSITKPTKSRASHKDSDQLRIQAFWSMSLLGVRTPIFISKTDETVRICRLTRVFAWSSYYCVGFVVLCIIYLWIQAYWTMIPPNVLSQATFE